MHASSREPRPPRHSLDLRGLVASFALLKASQAFRALEAGERLEILFEPPLSPEEILRVLPAGAAVETDRRTEERGTSWRLAVEKRVPARAQGERGRPSGAEPHRRTPP